MIRRGRVTTNEKPPRVFYVYTWSKREAFSLVRMHFLTTEGSKYPAMKLTYKVEPLEAEPCILVFDRRTAPGS
jgi:hypothetical protein